MKCWMFGICRLLINHSSMHKLKFLASFSRVLWLQVHNSTSLFFCLCVLTPSASLPNNPPLWPSERCYEVLVVGSLRIWRPDSFKRNFYSHQTFLTTIIISRRLWKRKFYSRLFATLHQVPEPRFTFLCSHQDFPFKLSNGTFIRALNFLPRTVVTLKNRSLILFSHTPAQV